MHKPGNAMKKALPLRTPAEYLVRRFHPDDPEGKKRGLNEELLSLSYGRKEAVYEYYVHKAQVLLLLILFSAGIGIVVFVAGVLEDRSVAGGKLQREGYGGESRTQELIVAAEGLKETEEIDVFVQSRQFSEEEARKILECAVQELEGVIPGDNESLDEVRMPLNLPSELQNGYVHVEWMTIPYGILSETGQIEGEPEEKGSIVELRGTLDCQHRTMLYERAVRVFPPVLTEEESLWKRLQQRVAEADEKGAHSEYLSLPDEVNGRKLNWKYPSSGGGAFLILLLILVPFFVFFHLDQRVHEKAQERRVQLQLDYSDLMWKLSMLLGAGLTIRGAFTRIARQYQEAEPGERRYVYEEMLYACHEMNSGIEEGKAYEHFGRRCALPCYIKLGSVLSQSLHKGSRGLGAVLEKEAVSSMEDRKHMARKLGEQAGTKMLFPMILMFGVVLVILVVPAFMAL